MSCDLGPGCFVECIDASPERLTGLPIPLVRGAIYRVAAVVRAPDFSGVWGDALVLDHVGSVVTTDRCGCPAKIAAFNPERFRPLYRPPADFIERLLARPAPERERENA